MNNKRHGIIRPFLMTGKMIGQGSRLIGFSLNIMAKYTVSDGHPWDLAVMQFLMRAEEEFHENRQMSETVHITLNLLNLYLNKEQNNREHINNDRIFKDGPQLEKEKQQQVFCQLKELVGPRFQSPLEGNSRTRGREKLMFSAVAFHSLGAPFEQMRKAVAGHSRILNGRELFRRSAARQQKEFYLSMMRNYVVQRTESIVNVYLGRKLEYDERQLIKEYIGRIGQPELIADVLQNDSCKYEETAGIIFSQLQSRGEGKVQKPEHDLNDASVLQEMVQRVGRLGAIALDSVPELLAGLPKQVYMVLSEKTGNPVFTNESNGNMPQALTEMWRTSTSEERRQILNQVYEVFKYAAGSSNPAITEKQAQDAIKTVTEKLEIMMEYDALCSRLRNSVERQIVLEYLLPEKKDSREYLGKEEYGSISDKWEELKQKNTESVPELLGGLPKQVYMVLLEKTGNPVFTKESNGNMLQALTEIWRTSTSEERRQILNQIYEAFKNAAGSLNPAISKAQDAIYKVTEKLKNMIEYDALSSCLQDSVERQTALGYLLPEKKNSREYLGKEGYGSLSDEWEELQQQNLESVPALLAGLPKQVYMVLLEKTGNPVFTKESNGNMPQALTEAWRTSTSEDRRQILNRVYEAFKYAAGSLNPAITEKQEQDAIKTVTEKLENIMEYDALCSRLRNSVERQTALGYLLPEKKGSREYLGKEGYGSLSDEWEELQQQNLESVPALLAGLPKQVYMVLLEKTGNPVFTKESNGNMPQALTEAWRTSTSEDRRQILNQVYEAFKYAAGSLNPAITEKQEQDAIKTVTEKLKNMIEYDALSSRLRDSVERQTALGYLLPEKKGSREYLGKAGYGSLSDEWEELQQQNLESVPALLAGLPKQVYTVLLEKTDNPVFTKESNGNMRRL